MTIDTGWNGIERRRMPRGSSVSGPRRRAGERRAGERRSAESQAGALRRLFAGIWGVIVLRGALAILFGLLALYLPATALLSLVLVFAGYMLLDGVFALASSVMASRRGERWELFLAEGVANIAAGMLAAALPELTVLVFILLLAGWAIISGALMVGAAINHRRVGKPWLAFAGVVSVLFGIALAVAPLVGAVVLTWWLGVYALVFGAALVIFGLKLRGIAAE
jgi:uncharacterized membrane protein HdeD (DUF308 family)